MGIRSPMDKHKLEMMNLVDYAWLSHWRVIWAGVENFHIHQHIWVVIWDINIQIENLSEKKA
jgi:hypothetical protein